MPWIVAGSTVVYELDLELPPVLRVRAPPAHQPQALPRLRPQQRTHHRQQIRTGAVGGHPGDRVAGLLVGVGDPLQHRVQHRPARTTPLPRPGPATRWSPAPSCQPARPRPATPTTWTARKITKMPAARVDVGGVHGSRSSAPPMLLSIQPYGAPPGV